MSNFRIQSTKKYDKSYIKLVQKNPKLKDKVIKAVQNLSNDPHYPSLKTHLINDSELGRVWSSRVTGDLRILWQYVDGELVILLLKIGGHEGSGAVYR